MSPIVGEAILYFPDEFITSVTVANTESHTVAFLGTNDGVLKKVLLSGNEAFVYESIIIDKGNRLMPDTLISPDGEHIYVLSTSKISKVQVEHCSSYINCSSCLDAKDPYCGWCSLEKR